MKTQWHCKHFTELTTEELYRIFNLRIAIFVIEQKSPYQDADGKDLNAYHVMGYPSNHKQSLIAYCRLLPAGLSYNEVSIGRVVTSPQARKTGAGKELMQQAMNLVKEKFGIVPVRISAQAYLYKFYMELGFVQVSDTYLEDNLPHIEMLYTPK